jgi:sugar O-acyltransferase (sialic acid O-acetyltransferase NeuD family)
MREILILGTGAVAAELTSYFEDNNIVIKDENDKLNIKGYIEYDHNIENYWKKYELKAPVLGDIDSYEFQSETEVFIAISNVTFKTLLIEKLEKKGVRFPNFVHHSSIVSSTVQLGRGNIIYPHVIIGPKVEIRDFNLITSYSFISHDCIIGSMNFFSTTGLAGKVEVGDNNFFGIRSTVIPSVNIGSGNTIQAGMVVDKDVADHTTVFHRFKEKVMILPKTN